jgi:hypothetical protein
MLQRNASGGGWRQNITRHHTPATRAQRHRMPHTATTSDSTRSFASTFFRMPRWSSAIATPLMPERSNKLSSYECCKLPSCTRYDN